MPDAHGAVAAEVDEAREHDVAGAGQAAQRLGLGAHLARQPPDLRAPLRHQRRHRGGAQVAVESKA